ncbi:MAG: wax ester/triacylglycerol synthase family O-acyltransferase [Proteobacteria bacterium]|nr:MAG: wax ester/triacylglycerol synthase family O-acyltransferase [Pseudomonadota bacterium]
MQQLSELDVSFLHLETDHTPMHNGGLYLFDSTTSTEPLTFERFRQFVESKLPVADFFRKRIVEVPLRLDNPYRVDDPEFDINRHLHHIEYSRAVSLTQLNRLAAKLLATPLKRDRPLWEITFVDGLSGIDTLPESCFALIAKTHHSAIDPLSGKDIMGVLLDFSANPTTVTRPEPWQPQSLPSTLKLLGNAYTHALSRPLRPVHMIRETVSAKVFALLLRRLNTLNLLPDQFCAPRTAINRSINEDRSLDFAEIPLEKLKDIKNKIGHEVTINDVITGICAQAASRFLELRGERPKTSLVALSPISVRSKNLHSPTGHQMAAMMISLATDEPDPAWRIVHIHKNAEISNNYSQAVSAPSLTRAAPSSMVALAARIYTEFQLAQRHNPLFNLPLINIPGPQNPLYLQGCKLIRQAASSPLFDGIGLGIVAISYQGSVTFSVSSCPSGVCDASELVILLNESVADIESAAEDILQETPPAYTPGLIKSPSLTELGSAVIGDAFSPINNLFSFGKDDARQKVIEKTES